VDDLCTIDAGAIARRIEVRTMLYDEGVPKEGVEPPTRRV
jgi:hypothetical protein